MTDLPIRILLVLALVAWSPAWCCCALQAASASESGAGLCEGRWASASGERAIDRNLPPCCLSRTVVDERDTENEAGARNCCEDQDSSCNCSDRPDELTRLDTAGKVILPVLDRNLLAVVRVDPYQHDSLRQTSAWLRLHTRPPDGLSRTLLAQRCMLLT